MTVHQPRPFWGAEGEVCAVCGDWWPCDQDEAALINLGTCGGCGAYGQLGQFHSRHGEECGEFV